MQRIPTFKLIWQYGGIAQYSVSEGPVPMRLCAWIDHSEGHARLWAPARDSEVGEEYRYQEYRDLRCYTVDPELIAPLPALFEAIGAFSPQLAPLIADEEEKPDYYEFHSFTGVIGARPFNFWVRCGVPGGVYTPLYRSLISALNKVEAAAMEKDFDRSAP